MEEKNRRDIVPGTEVGLVLKNDQKIDKSVQVIAVEQSKKKNFYRVTLLKDRKSGSADLKKDVIERYFSQEGKGTALRKALGKAVSHLSIRYRR